MEGKSEDEEVFSKGLAPEESEAGLAGRQLCSWTPSWGALAGLKQKSSFRGALVGTIVGALVAVATLVGPPLAMPQNGR